MTWRRLRVAVPAGLIFIVGLIYFSPPLAALLYFTFLFLTPVWLPLFLLRIAWPLWLAFARMQFLSGIEYSLLELKPGPETPKSAKAMELVFYSLYHRSEISKKEYLLGHVRPWWSFEIYIRAGKARFFAHVPKAHIAAFQARVQNEYRDLEIDIVRDYAREIPFEASTMSIYAREYTLTKPDPYPIRSYEATEAKGTDAMAEMLLAVAEIGEDEHILISYLVRPHQRERMRYFEEPKDSLHADAYRVIASIIGSHGDMRAIPPAKQGLVSKIEKALQKPSFDCGIRALYVAPNNAFKKTTASELDALFNGFSDDELNSFTSYSPEEQLSLIEKESFALSSHLRANYLMNLYRSRLFFVSPHKGKAFILNTEELATIFHMPFPTRGGILAHPSHVELEPPANLPV